MATAPIDRRTALGLIGGIGAAVLLGACDNGSSSSASSSTSVPSGPSGASSPSSATSTSGGTPACVLAPETTEGPFYLDLDAVRSDITEGRPGTPLALGITIVDAASCREIGDAAVDIWHTDASGTYSGVNGGDDDSPFMRGTQVTAADGRVAFTTIYPGWYQGRAVHIHVKVHAGGGVVHTGQLFFPDDVSDVVYSRGPYASRGAADTTNADDGIFRDGDGATTTLALANVADGYRGDITLGVRT